MNEERRSAREIELEEEVRRLKKRLETDRLTGAINTEGFEKEMQALQKLANKGLLEAAILILADVDDFKKCNDRLGHSFGDEVLKTVAVTLQANGRKTDTAIRFGDRSDEFALILPGANTEVGTRTIREIEDYLKTHPVKYEGTEEYISITMGLASFPETPLNQLRKVADLNMLQNKKSNGAGR